MLLYCTLKIWSFNNNDYYSLFLWVKSIYNPYKELVQIIMTYYYINNHGWYILALYNYKVPYK